MATLQQHLRVESGPPVATTHPPCDLAANVQLREIPSLSGLRAFASLTVVLCHVVSPSIPGPYAVTLFFALSGFLITILLCREIAATGAIDIRGFYLRRVRRLLPAYYVWLAAVVLFLTGRVTPEIAAAAFYLSDYFNAWVRQGPISHTWSLSVEEHFYLLWPIILSASFRSKRFVPAIVAAIVIVQAARFAFASAYPLYFFYSFEAKIDALLLGCLLGIWAVRGGVLPAFLIHRWSLILSVAGWIVCAFLPSVQIRTIGNTVVAWLSVLLIAQVVASPPAILNNRVTSYLGNRSYGLYLYHVLVRGLYMALMPASRGTNFNVHGPANQVAVILLSIGAASLSYRYVERPLRSCKSFRAHLAVQ
ncbi:MAG TPA: acyltransferase [Bryobacteraceae bacterium]|jgi:peptidoglycan/LPS O-acetylase OafA/YrhL|nr:acyltransferase [Bryobacteraceae bacterium]